MTNGRQGVPAVSVFFYNTIGLCCHCTCPVIIKEEWPHMQKKTKKPLCASPKRKLTQNESRWPNGQLHCSCPLPSSTSFFFTPCYVCLNSAWSSAKRLSFLCVRHLGASVPLPLLSTVLSPQCRPVSSTALYSRDHQALFLRTLFVYLLAVHFHSLLKSSAGECRTAWL